jgi:hypothetical protein
LSAEPIIREIARKMWSLVIRVSRTISFGIKPKKGGRPPRERRRVIEAKYLSGEIGRFADVCLIE